MYCTKYSNSTPQITAYHVIQHFYNFDNCALLPLPQGDKVLVKMKFQRKGFRHLQVEIRACSDWPAQWQLLHLYQPLHDSETDSEGTPLCRCLVGWVWAAYGLHPAEAGTVACSPSQPVGKRTEHNVAAVTLAKKEQTCIAEILINQIHNLEHFYRVMIYLPHQVNCSLPLDWVHHMGAAVSLLNCQNCYLENSAHLSLLGTILLTATVNKPT